ncbi:MAG: c-type cytochrome domain-containing protein [Ginsengibacter sp.]
MTLLAIFDLIGRLHPMLVHLPVGILIIACFFQWLALNKKFAFLLSSVQVIIFWGMISAVFSCITGFVLSQSGDYDHELVTRHQWFGISVASFALILYFIYRTGARNTILTGSTIILAVIIFITGHLGGSLTHGSNYLAEGYHLANTKGPAIKPIANVPEAILYDDAVKPLLQARCYSCHGPSKQKGKLRLDSPEFILTGGEDGKAIVPGKPGEGELLRRLLLPIDNEDHMPPKEKTQLSATEIEILDWWISTGADVHKKIKELPQSEKSKPLLLALQTGASENVSISDEIPAAAVEPAGTEALLKLKMAGINPVPVATNSNYLSVSLISAIQPIDTVVKLLEGINKQVIWLNAGNTDIQDRHLSSLSKLKNLTRLYLNNTSITDTAIVALKNLENLTYLNLTSTNISGTTLSSLQGLQRLHHIYLFNTKVDKSRWAALRQMFPNAVLDSGGYSVPTFKEDTSKVKMPGG